MKIALCDDEITALNILKAHINTYCAKENLAAQLACFSSGEDFLNSPHPYDIVFMDIYLSDTLGTEVVRQSNMGKNTQIVFTTTSRDHALEAFGLNATHYLTKPLSEDAVADAMTRCLLRMNALPEKVLEVKTPSGTVPVPMSSIIFIEVFNKISTVHTEKNDLQTYTPLEAICELLDRKDFLRVQRSFVVNMHYIESFFFDRVVLHNGMVIMLSRSNRQTLKNEYQRFLFQLARSGNR